MSWRVAKSLITLRNQFNERFPRRNKASDGTIGDSKHASRASDHNPHVRDAGQGVVTALDITHDPKNGVDVHAICEYMRQRKDPRLKYCISNGRIFAGSAGPSPWIWRPYRGSNPHRAHAHWSVRATKGHYDDMRRWELWAGPAPAITGSLPEEPEQNPDAPSLRPVLRRGSKGNDVQLLQRLLSIKVDGSYGPSTEAAVRAFQRATGLPVDGVVGPMTYAELDDLENLPTDRAWQRNIVATVFGGTRDPNQSAYEPRQISDDEIGVALPYRFSPGERPQVEIVNVANGRSTIAEIVDVGPWETRNPYWETGERPRAESGKDSRGRTTNLAGIDLTPGAAKEIGLIGKGMVHWAFAETEDEGEAA